MTKIIIAVVVWGKIWETYTMFDWNVVAGIHALIEFTKANPTGAAMGQAAVGHFMLHVNLPLDWTVYILQFTFERCPNLDPIILQEAIEVVKEAYSHHTVSPTLHTWELEPHEWLQNHWRDLPPIPEPEPEKDLRYYMRTWYQTQPYPRKMPVKDRRPKK